MHALMLGRLIFTHILLACLAGCAANRMPDTPAYGNLLAAPVELPPAPWGSEA